MKLKRLLSLAVLCIVGMSSAWAQDWTDVTNTYIQNANLSSGTGSWATSGNWADGNGTANGTTYVLENYSGWGSQEQTDFSLTQTVTLPAGIYKMTGYSLYSANAGNVKLVAKSGDLTISSANPSANTGLNSNNAGGKGSDDLKKFANSCNVNYPQYLTTIIFEIASETSVTLGYVGKHTAYRQWFACGPFALYKFNGKASSSSSLDFTTMIYNPGFEDGNTNGWSIVKSSDTDARSTTDNTYKMTGSEGNYLFNTWWKGNPCTQNIASMPAGKYKLEAVVASDGATIYLINGNNSDEYSYIETGGSYPSNGVGQAISKEFLLPNATTDYKIGVVGGADGTAGEHKAYQEDGYWWYKADNFRLTYYGNGVEHYATNLPAGNTTVDDWYVIPINVAGDYKVTSTAGGTIYYTQDGTQALSEEFSTTTNGSTLDLQVGKIYVKTSVATTLSIEAYTKSYTVGTATTDKTYVQPGQTVTVTYADAATNDADATFAKNGNPSITIGGQAVTINETANGFTFTMPTLAAGADHTLSIPAKAFGYTAGSTFNAAQNLTIKTPAVNDGVYYIKDQKNRYLSRGADSNTEAALDAFGIPVRVTTDANNVTSLYTCDGNQPIVENADPLIYTNGKLDNANHKLYFTLAVSGSGVSIKTERGNWMAAIESRSTFGPVANSNGQSEYAWTFEPASEHAAVMTALKNAQASAAATAAGLTASTAAELETAITNAGLSESPVSVTALNPTSEYFQSVGTSKGSVEITVAGLYKMIISGYTRVAGYNAAYTQYAAGNENVVNYVYLGETKTQMASLFSEGYDANTTNCAQPTGASKWYPDRTAAGDAAFTAGMYKNVVWAYLTPGEYEYGIAVVSNPATANWVWYSSNVTLVRYSSSINPGDDMTGKITNPGFETGNTDGWTVTASGDTGAKSTTNDTYKAIGTEGNYVFNHWSDGTALTQNIGAIPAGIYTLSAMLATGDSPTSKGTVYLTVGDTKSAGMTSRNGNKQVMRQETITFVSDGTSDITIGAIGAETGNGGHWWYKADAFKLTYINENTAENLYNIFKEVYDASEPWSSDAYATTRSGYASYSASTSQADLLAAINYMNSKYDDYAWDNASEEHPYLLDNVIKNAGLATNDEWPGSGRSMASQSTWAGQHWSGDASRDYFEQNHENNAARTQAVVIPFSGQYSLNTAVRVLESGAYAEIAIGEDKTRTTDVTGTTGGNINIDGSEGTDNMANNGNGFGWVYNKVVFTASEDLTAKTISINLSNRDRSHAADAGGMFLYYIGDKYDYTKNGVHYYSGAWTDEAVELTNEVPVLDVTAATGSFNVTATNANGLVYTNGATVNGVSNNIVSNGTCANLVLTDGGTFKAHKAFTASSASYNMTAIAGDKFGTLMLPFAATTMPDGNKVYTLDQGVSFGEEIHASEANAIKANKPVLVTAAGTYSADGVDIAATNDTYENGELVGTYKATTAIVNTYVLQNHSGRVAFFMVNTEGVTTVNPFRAYIKAQSAGVKALSVIFDDEETAIEEIEDGKLKIENSIFDLSGRRVQKAQKGIYIVNGKKVVIK